MARKLGHGPKPKPLLMLTLKERLRYYPETPQIQDSFVSYGASIR
jgi:hypothetical protein